MTTLKQIRERLIDELQIGFYGTADSISTTGVTWVLRFQNNNWGGNQFKNWWGHRPDMTGNDVVKPMTTLAGAVLSTGSSVYADTGPSKYFSLTRPEWHPTIYMQPLINRALEKAWQWWRTVLSPVVDGDMEAATAGAWTGTNCGMVKDSTTFVWDGTRSGDVTNTGANGYMESATFEVAPNRSYRFTAKVRPRVGTPWMQVVDKTSGTVLQTITCSQPVAIGAWQDLQMEGTFGNNTVLAAIRLGATGASDRASWDDVQGYWNLLTRFSLPSWVTQYRTEDGTEALRFYKVRNRLGTIGNWSSRAYDLMLLDPRTYQVLSQPSALNPLEVEFSREVMLDGFPILVEARRPFSDFGTLAAETDVTGCPLRLAVAAAKVLASFEMRTLTDRQALWLQDYDREQKRVSSLLHVPAPDQSRGLAFQVWA